VKKLNVLGGHLEKFSELSLLDQGILAGSWKKFSEENFYFYLVRGDPYYYKMAVARTKLGPFVFRSGLKW